PPLDLAGLGQLAHLGIVERLPGPAEHLGVVARNQEVERFVPLARGVVEDLAAPAVAEEFVEGFHAPPPQRVPHALGVFGLGWERIIQKRFQIPAQLTHQVAVGTPLDREANRRGNGHRLGAARVLGTDRLKLGRITRFYVPDEECIHAKAPTAAAPCRDSSCDSTMICKAMLWERWPRPLSRHAWRTRWKSYAPQRLSSPCSPCFPEFAAAVRYGVPGTLQQLGMVSPELLRNQNASPG